MLAFSRLFLFAAMTFASTATVSSAYAEKRVALVIGNDKYPNLPPNQQLLKAGNDADAIGNAFAALGFKVIRGKNLGRQAIIDRLSELTSAVGPDDTVALFFAGHGVAIGGVNYIVPSDVPEVVAGSESRVRGASIAETDLIAEIQTKNVQVALLVLDACRDNPFPVSGTRSIGNTRGLTESRPARGVFTIYSAGIGQQALDRLNDNEKNPNSVFTRIFAQKLTQPGLTLGDLAVEVREQVAELAQTYKDPDGTPHEQTPAYYDQTIGGRVYLAGRGSVLEQSKPNLPLPSALSSPAIDEITWDFLKQSTDTESLRRFTSQFPLSTRKTEAIQRIADLERAAKDAQSKAKKDNPSIASQPPSEQAPSKSWTSFFAPSKASTELQKSTEPSGQSYGGAATDQEAWASIKNSTDLAVLRQFASRFPASQYGFQANDRIAKLEAATEENIRQNAITRDRDLGTISIDFVPEAWEKVKNSTDPQAFESFLGKLNLLTRDDVTQQIYLSTYVDQARSRLQSIRRYQLNWSGWKDLSDSAKLGLLQSDQASAPSAKQSTPNVSEQNTEAELSLIVATDCDRLAAHPDDLQRPKNIIGVKFARINVGPARTVCEQAIKDHPEVPRFKYEYARVLDQTKEYEASHDLFLKAAALGDPDAMVYLGAHYEFGFGFEKNYAQAREWYEKGAEAGSGPAMANLGAMYREGHGVPRDYAAARQWFEKAAATGCAEGMRALGDLYFKGFIGFNYTEARKWFERAAAAGDADSMQNLSVMYRNGLGVNPSQDESERWLKKAAELR